ncbi:MAG TPA: TRL-like family protein [Candidatus Sumerlaeota bacterium]|nr:TRL-like family protein [Candidatus Sumerlaeota bacterium]HMX62021.1 TRL-like family protein [Candidatus Sumerlaeota bacterium]HNM46725.1 TRL-like family protein [Candidatus Sumerlaeota bacterium]
MKKKLLGVVGAAAVAVSLTGCLSVPVMPPYGIVYTDYKAPLDFDQEKSPVGDRSGSAETMSIVGLVAMGDASIQTAAEDGNIKTIYGADYEYFNVLGIYQTYKTVVHGE